MLPFGELSEVTDAVNLNEGSYLGCRLRKRDTWLAALEVLGPAHPHHERAEEGGRGGSLKTLLSDRLILRLFDGEAKTPSRGSLTSDSLDFPEAWTADVFSKTNKCRILYIFKNIKCFKTPLDVY